MDRDFSDVLRRMFEGVILFKEEAPAKFEETGVLLAAFGVMHVTYPCMEKGKEKNFIQGTVMEQNDAVVKD
jgi:hypothetical protein